MFYLLSIYYYIAREASGSPRPCTQGEGRPCVQHLLLTCKVFSLSVSFPSGAWEQATCPPSGDDGYKACQASFVREH